MKELIKKHPCQLNPFMIGLCLNLTEAIDEGTASYSRDYFWVHDHITVMHGGKQSDVINICPDGYCSNGCNLREDRKFGKVLIKFLKDFFSKYNGCKYAFL